MLICIDVGHSNINYGIYKDNNLVCTFKSATSEITSVKKLYDEFLLALSEFGLVVYDMEFAVISCVVENLNQVLKEFCKKINIECYFIDNLSPLGIYNKTEDEVGADLLAGAYEAVKLYHLPLVLVDFGTATNITLINENSEIEGSISFYGVSLAYKSLNKMISGNLYDVESSVLASNKNDSIKNGLVFGSMQAIDNMINSIRKEKNFEYMNVIVTGGLGQFLYQFIEGASYNENLVLDGLRDIYFDIGKKLYLRTKDMKIISSD